MNRSGAIYQIKCVTTGKMYIGSTVDPKGRFYTHRRELLRGTHHSPKLQNAWDKYGPDSFAFEIVEEVDDVLFLIAREQCWIWRNEGMLLNCALIAGSPLGVRRSDEQKARMSIQKLAYIQTEEGKAAMANLRASLLGRVMSDEEREMRSRALKGKAMGREWTSEARAAHSLVMAGRKMPPVREETKNRISAANKGKKRTPEAIARSVAARQAFVGVELPEWQRLKAEGKSIREIERITGRSRKMIARELGTAA